MTPPVGSKASFIAAAEAAAKARGVADTVALASVRADARDQWESRLSLDPQTRQQL